LQLLPQYGQIECPDAIGRTRFRVPGEHEHDMKLKVHTQDLRIGMYVTELDRPWRETPFLFQGFEISSDEELKTLQAYCRSVYVLTTPEEIRTRSHAPISNTFLTVSPNEARLEKAALLDQAMLKINNHPGARSTYDEQTTLEEEIGLVKEYFESGSNLIQDIMWQAKFGKSLDVPGAQTFVKKMVESVIRNPDALACFVQIKRKDEYTAMHSLRVSVLSMIFARQLDLPTTSIEQLGLGALLLDVGKMKIPSEILNKPEALDAEELHLVKGHVDWGVEILQKSQNVPSVALDIAHQHHERFDGSGYGERLKGDEITQFARIAGMVDFYDAITSDRAYRAGISSYAALQKMYGWRNTLFESTLVEKFIQCLGIYPVGSVVELNTGEIAVVAALNRQQRLKPRVVLVLQKDKTPYLDTPLTNLVGRKTSDGRACEIERVLDPSSVNIDPARYLPLQNVA